MQLQESRIHQLFEEIVGLIKETELKNRALYTSAIDIEDERLSLKTQADSFKVLRKMKGLKSAMQVFRKALEDSGFVKNDEVYISGEYGSITVDSSIDSDFDIGDIGGFSNVSDDSDDSDSYADSDSSALPPYIADEINAVGDIMEELNELNGEFNEFSQFEGFDGFDGFEELQEIKEAIKEDIDKNVDKDVDIEITQEIEAEIAEEIAEEEIAIEEEPNFFDIRDILDLSEPDSVVPLPDLIITDLPTPEPISAPKPEPVKPAPAPVIEEPKKETHAADLIDFADLADLASSLVSSADAAEEASKIAEVPDFSETSQVAEVAEVAETVDLLPTLDEDEAVSMFGELGGLDDISDLGDFSDFGENSDDELLETLGELGVEAPKSPIELELVSPVSTMPEITPQVVPEVTTQVAPEIIKEDDFSGFGMNTPNIGVYSGRTPAGFVMFGRKVDAKDWTDMLTKICEILILKNPYTVAQFDKYQDLNPTGKVNFSYNQGDIKIKAKKLSNGLWTEIGRTPDEIVMFCKKLLEICGYPRSELEIEFDD